MNIWEKVIGDVGEKRRWCDYKARVRALPGPYRETAEALERYLLYFGATEGELWLDAFDDLADLLEQASADGTPVRDVVGADPVDFVEAFAANYGGAGWINKERRRLIDAVSRAELHQDGAKR
ncbi:MAG: DUF1048 domain-containing protein [Arachnia sp.]